MGNHVRKGIVTDGLVLYLDAAHPKSYPGTGTTWKDLSGLGNHGTLVNGPVYNSLNGGSMVFDGVNDHVVFGNILSYTSQNFTFSYWVYHNTLTLAQTNGGNPQGPIVFFKGRYKQSGYYEQTNIDGAVWFITNQTNAVQATKTNAGVISPNAWYNVCCVRSGASVKIYVNGVDKTAIAETHINPQVGVDPFSISLYYDIFYMNSKLPVFMNYNRALTAAEVQQNYEAHKMRYHA